MTFTRPLLIVLSVAASLLSVSQYAQGAPITFVFDNNSEFDGGASAGATMTRDEITLTSVEVRAPEIVDDTWDGVSFVDAETNVVSTPNTLGVNNPTVGGTSEAQSFHPQESWTVEFNESVVVNNIGFQAFSGADVVNIYVGETFFSFDAPATVIADPFAGMMIPAGTDIRFEAPGDPLGEDGSVWRIRDITVTASVPEPSSGLLLAAIAATGYLARRKRHALRAKRNAFCR